MPLNHASTAAELTIKELNVRTRDVEEALDDIGCAISEAASSALWKAYWTSPKTLSSLDFTRVHHVLSSHGYAVCEIHEVDPPRLVISWEHINPDST